ncbi:RNA polymerase sporulation sigma factor SigE [Caldicellulosiruptor naganoensis]|uniref:RNA polymerase sporulation sigma factor SigE n=1 Tax=Caldicellulosiruptor naganoensis TaxID=29324 RepID=A0ABY7BIC9_9FIRM|nr:RNA polymerase sporulation sigma factor SigE [Caldicellulosiruptor naganoensis]WAM31104.1 RNA polymerase sporulation sigma factor SigE [Caldicellulosiruptor naganoensis]
MEFRSRLLNYVLGLLKKLGFQLSDSQITELFYVGGCETLSPPLTPEEETEVLNKIHYEGKEELKKVLIERNLRLVVYIARKFENTKVNLEDLVPIGTIGLIKAINTYNPHKNIKLATYASKCIENEILMFLRRNSHRKLELSIDEPLNIDWNGNELLLSDVLGTDTEGVYSSIENNIEKEALLKAIQKLPKREKRIVELRFGFGDEGEKTQKEVADCWGFFKVTSHVLRKRLLQGLKKNWQRLYKMKITFRIIASLTVNNKP